VPKLASHKLVDIRVAACYDLDMDEQHSTWWNSTDTEPEHKPRPTTAEKLAARKLDRDKRLGNPAAADFERRVSAASIDPDPAYH